MFWSKKVKVTFVDASSGKVMGVTSIAPEDLPDSFEANTTVTLQNDPWQVLAAEPVTRAEYAKSRTLRLSVRKLDLTQLSPGDILYSLPTICDVIPPLREGSSKAGKRVLELHEDDWRQVELVSSLHRKALETELKSIELIFAAQRTPGGAFKSLHVRKEIPEPLSDVTLSMATLRAALPNARVFDGLGYQHAPGLIEGGFAFEASGLTIFGLEQDSRVAACCFRFQKLEKAQDHARTLARLTRDMDVVLVDWCKASVTETSESALGAYFASL
jgi:hypothetical protein